MTIEEIDQWFQWAAEGMFAAVEACAHSFYPCEDGPSCPFPRTIH